MREPRDNPMMLRTPFHARVVEAIRTTGFSWQVGQSLHVPTAGALPFGALVLVPLLTGLDANVALFTAGAGTLLFQIITRGRVPIFLASSFAFIAPIIYGVKTWGIPGTMCGLVAAGFLYIVLSLCIKAFGSGFLHRILPPVVVGPVIMVIGLVLAPVAVHMAMGRTGDGAAWLVPEQSALILAAIALVNFRRATERALLASNASNLHTIATGLQAYLVDFGKLPPADREATPEEWEAAVRDAVVARIGRHDGSKLYHLGIGVDAYALAIPGMLMLFKAAPWNGR